MQAMQHTWEILGAVGHTRENRYSFQTLVLWRCVQPTTKTSYKDCKYTALTSDIRTNYLHRRTRPPVDVCGLTSPCRCLWPHVPLSMSMASRPPVDVYGLTSFCRCLWPHVLLSMSVAPTVDVYMEPAYFVSQGSPQKVIDTVLFMTQLTFSH